MRIRIPARRTALFGAMFALALIMFLPLRLMLGLFDTGLTAREASGSIWAGSLKESRVGPAALGDLDARLSPLRLLIGEARIAASRPNAAPDSFKGALGVGGSRRSVESVTGQIPVDALIGPLSIASLNLTDVTIRFRDGNCDRAEGLVSANLDGATTGVPLPASVSGAARCDGGVLLLPLASVPGSDGLALRISGDGRYEARLSAKTDDPAIIARLTGAGFTLGPGGYAATFRGRF